MRLTTNNKEKKMEKKEKEMKKVGIDFYVRIIEKMGTEPVTTKELYHIIDDVEKEFNLQHDSNRYIKSAKRICSILGDQIAVEDDPKTKGHGRMKPKIYLISEDWAKIVAPLVVAKEKAVPVKSSRDKEWIEKIYSLLILANNSNQEFQLEDVRKGLGDDSIKGATLIHWSEKAKKFGVSLEIKPSSFGKRKMSFMIIGNIKTSFITLNDAYKKITGEQLPNIGFQIGMKIGKRIKRREVAPGETEQEATKEQYNGFPLLYYVGALIKHENKSLPILDIAKTLSRADHIISTEDILKEARKEPNLFKISSDRSSMRIEGETGWYAIQEKYSPEKYTRYEVIARISLPQDILNSEFKVRAEILSEISENDNIYKITVSYSEQDLVNVSKVIEYIKLQSKLGKKDTILNATTGFSKSIDRVKGDIMATYAENNTFYLLECEE